MTAREQVLHDALALPPEDRAFLAERLDESLSQGDFASHEIAKAWSAEIDRRIAAYEKGESQASGSDQAMERMRDYVSEYRNRKVNS